MTTVTITQLPVDTFTHFQWLLLGLYELERAGEIQLRFHINAIDRLSLLTIKYKKLAGLSRRLRSKSLKQPRYNLVGEVETGGKKRTFTVDSKDSPFIFSETLLEQCDAYFKLQCPKEISERGFPIMPGVYLPWMDINFGVNEGENAIFARKIARQVVPLRDKIHPAMVGPRRLTWTCRYEFLKRGYDNYLLSRQVRKDKTLTAYFGDAQGGEPSQNVTSYDMDWEWDLIAYLTRFHSNHPNEKRAQAVRLINTLGDGYDGRLINDIVDGKPVHHSEWVVPLPEFCDFVARHRYNLNISGFRLSIPNRFIESFISGTAIITDKLALKWYAPFEDGEVVETVEMGYLGNADVDWNKFRNDLQQLPPTDPERIISAYERKWSPTAFARYVVRTTLNSPSSTER